MSQTRRWIICLCLWSCLTGNISYADMASPSSPGETPREQVVSQPERILPLKRFLIFPVDPEGLPPGVGSKLQTEMERAFQERFAAVKGVQFKTLASYPDMDQAHPKNKPFWIRLSKEENVDACIYVRNEAYVQPDFVEQNRPDVPFSKGHEMPGAIWRIILIDGGSGEILWNLSWAVTGSVNKFKFVAKVEDSFPDLAEMMARSWPIHPQQWNLGSGVVLGAQLPLEHYGKNHILFSGVLISKFFQSDIQGNLKVVFPEDVKQLTYAICLPTEDIRKIRVDWYGPDKTLIRSEKRSSSFGPYIFDFFNSFGKTAGLKKGIWEIKVWEKEELLDHQLFQIGETAQPDNGSEPK